MCMITEGKSVCLCMHICVCCSLKPQRTHSQITQGYTLPLFSVYDNVGISLLIRKPHFALGHIVYCSWHYNLRAGGGSELQSDTGLVIQSTMWPTKMSKIYINSNLKGYQRT